jgi:gluconate 2-dehydrogenase gamma chain
MDTSKFTYRQTPSSTDLLIRRRRFLQSVLGGAGLIALRRVPAEIDLLAPGRGPAASDLAAAIEAAPWSTIGAVMAHLFPSEPNAPGATEVNALGYLQSVLGRDNREAHEDGAFLSAGAKFFRKRVAVDHHGRTFDELSESEREAALRKMTGSPDGANWVSMLMYYILEALLGDPVYGGNVNEVGWKWLDYTPGFPRPAEGKRYYELKNA